MDGVNYVSVCSPKKGPTLSISEIEAKTKRPVDICLKLQEENEKITEMAVLLV